MKFSIIVPVYNGEKFIGRLVNSVLKQTYRDFELILVDDGSSDKSYSLMKQYEEHYEKITAYTKENTGPGMTRKFGYEKSTGELLFFVDCDDWITDATSLEEIHNIFFSDPSMDILFFDREDIIGNRKSIISGFKTVSEGIHDIASLNEEVRPGLGAKILKREILRSDMFYESNVFEDLYTTIAYLENCQMFYYLPKVFYSIYHEEDSESLSSNESADMFHKSLEMILLIYEKTNKESLRYCLELRMTTLFTSYWRYKIKGKKEFTSIGIKQNIRKIVTILRIKKVIIKPNNKRSLKVLVYCLLLALSRVYI